MTDKNSDPERTQVTPQPESDLEVLRTHLAPKYEVVEKLGSGGMADVYLGVHNQLKREVAIKVLPRMFGRDKEMVGRFMQEAESAARLRHPNIIDIFDIGVAGPLNYFIMAYIPGGTLKDRIRKHGKLDIGTACRIVVQLCRALVVAHEAGVTHRDVKPDNVMFDEREAAVLTDFGIAKAKFASTKTATGTMIGTPHYMSPEQLKGQAVDGRSDIYSLGILFYEALTGEVPFTGDDTYAVGLKHIQEAPRPPEELNSKIPKPLNDIVITMLAKTREARFQSASEVEAALAEVYREGDLVRRLGTEAAARVSAGAEQAEESWRLRRSQVEADFERLRETLGKFKPDTPPPLEKVEERIAGEAGRRASAGPRHLLLLLGGIAVVAVVAAISLFLLLRPGGESEEGGERRQPQPGREERERQPTIESLFERHQLVYVERDGQRSLVRLLAGRDAEPGSFFGDRAELLGHVVELSYNPRANRFLVEWSNGGLITIDEEGRNVRNIYADPLGRRAGPKRARLSADGRLVAFTRSEGGAHRLVLVEIGADGSGAAPRTLLESAEEIVSPVFSQPDGGAVAFARFDPGRGVSTVGSIGAGGGVPEALFSVEGRILGLAASPDGGSLAYALRRGEMSSIYLYDFGTGESRRLTSESASDPIYSPDGHFVLFAADFGDGRAQIVAAPVGEGDPVALVRRLGSGSELIPVGWRAATDSQQ